MTLLTPSSLAALGLSSLASVPARRAVTSPEPSLVAAVTADRDAGMKVLFLYSRMARVERLEREKCLEN